MNACKYLKRFSKGKLVGFNSINRDRWVASIAKQLSAGSRILDVGAGPCRYISLFEHCKYEAQDFAAYEGTKEGLFKGDWTYGDLDYICDAINIPVDSETFDTVLCTEVLEHVPEPIEIIREVSRILKIGGKIFVSAPLGSGLHQQPYHYYGGFTPHFYQYFLSKFGFKILSIEPNGHLFRLYLQETNRVVRIVRSQRKYRFYHPIQWVLSFVGSYFVAKWLTNLDDELPIEEFTVGYFVEAIKVKSIGE